MPIRLVLADDHPIVLEGLTKLLESLPRYEVVGTATNGDDALSVIRAKAPAVAILDIRMPRKTGLEVAAAVLSQAVATRVVLLTAEITDADALEAIRLGVHGVILPTHRAAPLTAVAVKASAGASEHLALIPTDDLAATLADLHARGVRLVGADAAAPLSYREADLRGPVAIVVGSEGGGFSAGTRRRIDLNVRIPMRGHVESLNASVAGSILLFEVNVQRGTTPAPAADASPVEGAEPAGAAEPGD